MTGFARVRKVLPEGEIVVTVKSVNHRGLDIHLHLPPELEPLESVLRSAIKGRVARGHVQINVGLTKTAVNGAANLNRPLLESYLNAFMQACREFGLQSQPDLNVAFRIPGMFRTEAVTELSADIGKSLAPAMEEALELLNNSREREGSELCAEIRGRCASICELVSRIENIRLRAVATFHKRLKERLADLLRGASVEPQRLAQEAALLAERSDISEELIRLKTHTTQAEELLNTTGEIGKKLDFLLQEMNRETNTVLSKTGGLGDIGLTITELALAAKAEIDKIREQSLNLE